MEQWEETDANLLDSDDILRSLRHLAVKTTSGSILHCEYCENLQTGDLYEITKEALLKKNRCQVTVC